MKTIYQETYKNSKIKFVILSQTDVEVQSVMRIRTDIWSQPGWEGPQVTFELDKHDVNTTKYFAVLLDTKVIGGYRLIEESFGTNLPVAEYGAVAPHSGTEISRWCIDPTVQKAVKSAAHKVMLVGTLKYLLSHHIETSYMDVCSFLFKFLKRVGVQLKSIGSEHSRPDGSTFVPAVVDVRATATQCTLLH
jgi:N-acyl-L-homoserine lactone synthetase